MKKISKNIRFFLLSFVGSLFVYIIIYKYFGSLGLAKFRGIHKPKFYLHIKECEFRYNYRNENMYNFLLKNIKNNYLI